MNHKENGYEMIWDLSDEGVLTISGDAIMWPDPDEIIEEGETEYAPDGLYWFGCLFRDHCIRKVVVEDGVQCMYREAFAYTDIEEVVLPASLKRIPAWAFLSCPNLKTVSFDDKVTSVSHQAFLSCPALSPETRRALSACQEYCTTLDGVTWILDPVSHKASLPKRSIDEGFYCGNVTIPAEIDDRGNKYVFDGVIGDHLFDGSKDIPEGLELGFEAFKGCPCRETQHLVHPMEEESDEDFNDDQMDWI